MAKDAEKLIEQLLQINPDQISPELKDKLRQVFREPSAADRIAVKNNLNSIEKRITGVLQSMKKLKQHYPKAWDESIDKVKNMLGRLQIDRFEVEIEKVSDEAPRGRAVKKA